MGMGYLSDRVSRCCPISLEIAHPQVNCHARITAAATFRLGPDLPDVSVIGPNPELSG